MQALGAMMIATLALTPAFALAQGAVVQPPNDSNGGTGRPANLCQELVAFVKQPEAATKAAEAPPQLATAVTAKEERRHVGEARSTGHAAEHFGPERADHSVRTGCCWSAG